MFKLKIVFYWLRILLRGKFPDRKKLENFQQKKWKRFCQSVLSSSPFYAPFVKENTALTDFPVIEKSFFMENFSTINTLGIGKEEAMQTALASEESRNFIPELKGATVGLSTGTSGRRGLFMVSEDERAQWAAMIMNRVVKPSPFRKQRVAFFLRANSNLYTSVQSAFFEFRYFDIFRPIDVLAKETDVYQPHILAAPPSILVHLATLQHSEALHIRPEKIISFAEVLHPSDKSFIQSVFVGATWSEVYQCTEGFLGATCEYGTMHLNEDVLIFEKKYIDEKRFYPILTDFTRSSQPIVRYELNDILTEASEPCRCGSVFTALERIDGRADDVLLFTNKQQQEVRVYPDLLVRLIARATDSFLRYRIRQYTPTTLEVELETISGKEENVEKIFRTTLEGFLANKEIETVQISFKNKIALEPGAKLRKTERFFS
jgi:putative adenylate-forming enzyme